MKTLSSIITALILTITVSSQVPVLNSYPSAQSTLFLDFDGEVVQGTAWNWSGPIVAQPASLSTEAIAEIFNRVAEDYRIFNLNITTDSTVFNSIPLNKRRRIIITPTSEWYGEAGGVAYVGSFGWADNTPAWVFSVLLKNNIKYIAEAISHEAGHTLGLHHQSSYDASTCNKLAEYSGGQGTGEIGWAPIMGVGYYKNLSTWHNGANTMGCTSYQNDINVVANRVGLRTDDHSNSHTSAEAVTIGMNFSASGIINSATDKDVFKMNLGSTNHFTLSAIPQNVGSANAGANVDIKVALLNQAADTIARYNPADLLNVGLDTVLVSGTYYLVVDGVGNQNLSDYGSVGYYNLSGSLNSPLPVYKLSVMGRTDNQQHTLNWNFVSDEAIKEIQIETSKDGKPFEFLARTAPDIRTFNWRPGGNQSIRYRVKVILQSDERAYYSNIILLRNDISSKPVEILTNIVNDNIQVNAKKSYQYQVADQSGRLIAHGRLNAGMSTISTKQIQPGAFFVKFYGSEEVFTEKLIKR